VLSESFVAKKDFMTRILKHRYEILGLLGKGGMGCVYKVKDRRQGGKVLAAKELRAGGLSEEKMQEALAQFRTEARILMRLSHQNLPKVYDYFSIRDRHYIIMEYIAGSTLDELLEARQGKPVDEQLALSWALQICRAMHFLSVQKPRPIVFRDLKPSNIMIARDGRVKLIDFGIARFFKEEKREDTYVYGTPGYAAPEQYGSGQTDVRSDIFSLGATLHHCLTGRNPSENPLDFPEPRTLNPRLSRETAAILRKCLEPNMDRRYRTALEMKQAVQKIMLDSGARAKNGKKFILAQTGKVIRLPWWKKVSWVSVPVMALGCTATTGTLSSDDLWIKPKAGAFGPEAARLLFRVETRKLNFGKDYRPHITVQTDAGILRPQLIFRKSWPWIILEAAVAAAMIGVAVMMR
jgi:serine/threonine protein kinase